MDTCPDCGAEWPRYLAFTRDAFLNYQFTRGEQGKLIPTDPTVVEFDYCFFECLECSSLWEGRSGDFIDNHVNW